MRSAIVTDLLDEIRIIAEGEKEKRTGETTNAWGAMNYLLFEILESDASHQLTREELSILHLLQHTLQNQYFVSIYIPQQRIS